MPCIAWCMGEVGVYRSPAELEAKTGRPSVAPAFAGRVEELPLNLPFGKFTLSLVEGLPLVDLSNNFNCFAIGYKYTKNILAQLLVYQRTKSAIADLVRSISPTAHMVEPLSFLAI